MFSPSMTKYYIISADLYIFPSMFVADYLWGKPPGALRAVEKYTNYLVTAFIYLSSAVWRTIIKI